MPENRAPIGYSALVERFGLRVAPHHVASTLLGRGDRRTIDAGGGQRAELYPKSYAVEDSVGGQLEFALKYEGVNLEIMAGVFAKSLGHEIAEFVRRKPTGKHARRIWFFYEWLTGNRLPLDDLNQGSYVPALDPEDYYCGSPEISRRHRVRNNLPGPPAFCPLIRRTAGLADFEKLRLEDECRKLLRRYSPEVLARANAYLFTKETKSSFQIEKVDPDPRRVAQFVGLLELAGRRDFLAAGAGPDSGKAALVGLQRMTVEPRFAQDDWRTDQNYVGETLLRREHVHFIPPKPGDVPALMDGLFEAAARMRAGGVHPIVAAAALAFGFVFIHPFGDGNGRIHRFLIHNVLARSGFTPEGFIFPVSAAMLRKAKDYDETLEMFSKPLMPLMDYELDPEGKMTVRGDTALHYRYPDMTAIAERLFGFVKETLKTDFVEELEFIRKLDRAKDAALKIVEMPDRLLTAFVQICVQGGGRISKSKRKSRFGMLSDRELVRLEKCVADAFEIKPVVEK